MTIALTGSSIRTETPCLKFVRMLRGSSPDDDGDDVWQL